MKSKRRAEWTDALRAALDAQLQVANGRRSTRVMERKAIEDCVEAALESELGFAWRNAGESGDARALTTLCLAVVRDDFVTVAVATAHGAATPASAWADITSWDRFEPTSNRATCLAWAGRRRDDRVRLSLKVEVAERATKASLLARISEAPDDDAARLVYADLLAEEGDPRGEFIQVQCAGLEERAAELLEQHGSKWLGPEATSTLQVRFERGFVREARVLDVRALSACSAFFDSEPVTSLVVDVRGSFDGAALAAFDWTERLRELSLLRAGWSRPTSAGAEQLARLLEGRRWRAIERLSFRAMWLGDEGLSHLIERAAHALPSLQALSIKEDSITRIGARALAEKKKIAHLRELSLPDNELGVDGVVALVGGGIAGSLKVLEVAGNALGTAGANVIAASSRLSALRRLGLARNRVGQPGLQSLLDSPHLKRLESLDLTGNPIGNGGRERLQARFGRGAPHPETAGDS